MLEPKTAKARLTSIVDEARRSSFRPADLKMMEDLANVTAPKLSEFNNPAVMKEFVTHGPLNLGLLWWQYLISALAKS